MHQLLTLLRTNRFVQIALGATAGIAILVLVFSPHPKSASLPPPPPSQPLPSTTRPELVNLADEKRRASLNYRQTIEGTLPIYHKEFVTSVGLTTAINIYSLPTDPPETVRFEIYGLSYLNSNPSPSDNPNVTAFQESFNKGLELMRDRGLDPTKLIFIYGDVEYVRTTATAWVEHLGLLN